MRPPPTTEREPIAVACAVVGDGFGRRLVNLREKGSHLDGLWEFPGGRVEAGESPADAAVRECREEVGLAVRPLAEIAVITHDYGDRRVRLHFVACACTSAADAAAAGFARAPHARWVTDPELIRLAMPAANAPLVAALAAGDHDALWMSAPPDPETLP